MWIIGKQIWTNLSFTGFWKKMIVLFREGVNESPEFCWLTIITYLRRSSIVRLANVILLLLFQTFPWALNRRLTKNAAFKYLWKNFFPSLIYVSYFFISKWIHGIFSFLSLLGKVCFKYCFYLTMRNWWCLLNLDLHPVDKQLVSYISTE